MERTDTEPEEGSRRQKDGVQMSGRQKTEKKETWRRFHQEGREGKKYKRLQRRCFFPKRGSFIKVDIYERKRDCSRGRRGEKNRIFRQEKRSIGGSGYTYKEGGGESRREKTGMNTGRRKV